MRVTASTHPIQSSVLPHCSAEPNVDEDDRYQHASLRRKYCNAKSEHTGRGRSAGDSAPCPHSSSWRRDDAQLRQAEVVLARTPPLLVRRGKPACNVLEQLQSIQTRVYDPTARDVHPRPNGGRCRLAKPERGFRFGAFGVLLRPSRRPSFRRLSSLRSKKRRQLQNHSLLWSWELSHLAWVEPARIEWRS
jgi:hypothetical protein